MSEVLVSAIGVLSAVLVPVVTALTTGSWEKRQRDSIAGAMDLAKRLRDEGYTDEADRWKNWIHLRGQDLRDRGWRFRRSGLAMLFASAIGLSLISVVRRVFRDELQEYISYGSNGGGYEDTLFGSITFLIKYFFFILVGTGAVMLVLGAGGNQLSRVLRRFGMGRLTP